MALSDPFSTTYSGAYEAKAKGLGAFGKALEDTATAYVERQKEKRKAEIESAKAEEEKTFAYGKMAQEFFYDIKKATMQQKQEEIAAKKKAEVDLAVKGIFSAAGLPQEPKTGEDYQALAAGQGREMRFAKGATPEEQAETGRKLLEFGGIPISKRPQTFQVGGEEYYQGQVSGRNITDLSDLTPEKQLQVHNLARKIGGVRGAEPVKPAIAEGIRQGKTIDQIEDELRFAGQSKEFVGPVRNAAQTIMLGASEGISQKSMDYIDDLVSEGDVEGVKSQLKRLSLTQATADQKNNVVGMDTTVKLLNNIRNDFSVMEKMGYDTGFVKGSIENIMSRVGQVSNPDARRLATTIALALIEYRRAMTGVQFGMKEHGEYKKIFPDIDKVKDLNMANLDALERTFNVKLDNFYSLSMGEKNYNKLFKSQAGKNQDSKKQTIGRFTVEVE